MADSVCANRLEHDGDTAAVRERDDGPVGSVCCRTRRAVEVDALRSNESPHRPWRCTARLVVVDEQLARRIDADPGRDPARGQRRNRREWDRAPIAEVFGRVRPFSEVGLGERDSGAELAVGAAEDVRAVARASHPVLVQHARIAAAQRDVLAERVPRGVVAADPHRPALAVARVVLEALVAGHVRAVGASRLPEAVVPDERPQTGVGTRLVGQGQQRELVHARHVCDRRGLSRLQCERERQCAGARAREPACCRASCASRSRARSFFRERGRSDPPAIHESPFLESPLPRRAALPRSMLCARCSTRGRRGGDPSSAIAPDRPRAPFTSRGGAARLSDAR